MRLSDPPARHEADLATRHYSQLTQAPSLWHGLPVRRAILTFLALTLTACGTVDLGDNIVPPDLAVDDDFFFCQIQPNVLNAHSCASGGAGDTGGCHASRSGMRLSATAETDQIPSCDADNKVTGAVPESYRANLDAVRAELQSDPLSSPFYRRPVGLDSHPRVIFPESDPAAMLIVDWLSAGAM
jgi:hypothetical protein